VTIIVAMKMTMVADSGESQGDLMLTVGYPKIVRNSDGWLAGACGSSGLAAVFNAWFKKGTPETKPEMPDGKNFAALLMDPSGNVYRIEESLLAYPVSEPAICGASDAEGYVLGALDMGASPEQAVELASNRCVWVKGPVQVERIG
jgi:hypothetical protein